MAQRGPESQGHCWRLVLDFMLLMEVQALGSSGHQLGRHIPPLAGEVKGPGCVPVYNQVALGNLGPEARPQSSSVTLPGV